MRLFIALTFMFLLLNCKKTTKQDGDIPGTLAIITERDLIPEGTAYDPVTGQVFISSMYKQKIIAVRKDGTYYDFTREGQDSMWAAIGMEVDTANNMLWVISGKGEQGILTHTKPGDGSWDARLYCYDISSSTLHNIYHTVSRVPKGFCFNDLTVSSRGDVYLTESLTNNIFVLYNGGDSIEIFASPKGYTFLNGITISPDDEILFVSSTESLISINIETGKIKPLPYSPAVLPRPIDGLAFFKNSLIGHQSRMINRFFLNESMDSILRHETIDSIGLDGSTTGEIGDNGWYYYIGNSQLRSGIDYTKMEIMPWDSLESIVIKKVKL